MKRVLMQRGEPIAEAMRRVVPVDHGDLRDSITVGTRLSPRQKSRHRREGADDVEVFIGPGPHPQAHMVEFCTVNMKPQPYVRPAWDQERMNALDGIKADLWTEIEKAAARIARKTAKAGR